MMHRAMMKVMEEVFRNTVGIQRIMKGDPATGIFPATCATLFGSYMIIA